MPVMLKTLKFKPLSCNNCQFYEEKAIIVRGMIKAVSHQCRFGAKDYRNCPISNTPKFLDRQFSRKVAK